MSLVNISYLDFSGEKSSVAFNVVDPSGATYDWDALEALVDGIGDAIDAVCLCTRGNDTIRVVAQVGSQALPTAEEAQRELGLRIFYIDTTTQKKYHFTIPGPDLSLMVSAGFDQVDWSGTEMAALETALETSMKSPDGNAISITSGYVVGRRN
jgi:hypothetical protein